MGDPNLFRDLLLPLSAPTRNRAAAALRPLTLKRLSLLLVGLVAPRQPGTTALMLPYTTEFTAPCPCLASLHTPSFL